VILWGFFFFFNNPGQAQTSKWISDRQLYRRKSLFMDAGPTRSSISVQQGCGKGSSVGFRFNLRAPPSLQFGGMAVFKERMEKEF
jgi:hypothetical protein